MTTPSPLEQQRQWLREFQAAEDERAAREIKMQQQYAAGEKYANEKYAAAERAVQQEYAAAQQRVQQEYLAGIAARERSLKSEQAKYKELIQKIEDARYRANANIRAVVGETVTPVGPLTSFNPSASNRGTTGDPLSNLTSIAAETEKLSDEAIELFKQSERQKDRNRKLMIIVVAVLVVAGIVGFFLFQNWSRQQDLSARYSAAVAALETGDWQAARDGFSTLVGLDPAYRDAQTLLYESYYRHGKAALEAGEWQAAREQLSELLALNPDYLDAQDLLHSSYFLSTQAAIEAEDWNEVVNQLASWPADTRAAYADQVQSGTDNFIRTVSSRDGATYVFILSGEFLMGSEPSWGEENEQPQHIVYLDEYWIMQTEVTNAQYANCVAAGVCTEPANGTWKYAQRADLPVTYVDWEQAQTYAQWAGGRLPTEAEWEKAARGSDGRTYPWGEAWPDTGLANCCNFYGKVRQAGSFPSGASPYGVLDMAGNVWEWTADWFGENYYSVSPNGNPKGPPSGVERVLRGGAFDIEGDFVRCADRHASGPTSWNRDVGFRVVVPSY